jgi:hypothetical protein
MSYFLFHSSCDKCGSRDNRGVYSDGGSFCFGCGSYISPTQSPYVFQDNLNNGSKQVSTKLSIPEDSVSGAEAEGWVWVNRFGILLPELLQNKVQYSPSRKQLIYCFYDNEENLILYQARNFHPLAKQKYYTGGKPEEVLPIYYCKKEDNCGKETTTEVCGPRLVIVEDCLSAIKIARQSDSMPVLGSDLSLTKINRLARLYGAFTVWLDHDMFHKAQRICRRFAALGCEANAVWTELDPKCYNDEEISQVLLTGSL